MRIAKKGEPVVHNSLSSIKLGIIAEIKGDKDAAIIVTGRLLPVTSTAVDILEKEGYKVRLLSCHTLKPLDEETIVKAARETGALVACEEQLSLIGGLASASI